MIFEPDSILSILVWVIGVGIILVTLYDFLSTSLTVTGGGPVTGVIHASVWWITLKMHSRHASHSKLAWLGPSLAVFTLLLWATSTWLGWTLVFSSDSTAVVNSASMQPAVFMERAYFAGFSLTTLGTGDFQPHGTGWRIATVVMSANGLFLFTMAITYIVPVISALVAQRSLAAYCRRLGNTPCDVVIRSWACGNFESLSPHLVSLPALVDEVAQRYLAYPILHYFHSPESDTALPVRIAVLDEALSIMAGAVKPADRLSTQTIEPLRRSIEGMLSVLHSAHIKPADTAPPQADLRPLVQATIPVCSPEKFAEYMRKVKDRRCRLKSFVTRDGWSWDQVHT